MSRPDDVVLAHHNSEEALAYLDELCVVYADAYGQVAGDDINVKSAAFRDRATMALSANNYDLVTARTEGTLVGFVFGYSLRSDRGWWDGLTPEPPTGFAEETGSRTAVVAEIEVRQTWQGKGLGRALHDEFLRSRPEERATLSTGPSAEVARSIYERWGWKRMGSVPGKPGAYFSEYILYVLPLPSGIER